MLWNMPRWKAGDVIKAADLNRLVEAIERGTLTVSQDSGLEMQQGRGGTSLRVVFPVNRFVGVASGNISTRSSGTPGSGSVTLYRYDTTNGLTSLAINVSVLNASSTSMSSGNGIDSGKYCWIEQDGDGWWWVSPFDC